MASVAEAGVGQGERAAAAHRHRPVVERRPTDSDSTPSSVLRPLSGRVAETAPNPSWYAIVIVAAAVPTVVGA